MHLFLFLLFLSHSAQTFRIARRADDVQLAGVRSRLNILHSLHDRQVSPTEEEAPLIGDWVYGKGMKYTLARAEGGLLFTQKLVTKLGTSTGLLRYTGKPEDWWEGDMRHSDGEEEGHLRLKLVDDSTVVSELKAPGTDDYMNTIFAMRVATHQEKELSSKLKDQFNDLGHSLGSVYRSLTKGSVANTTAAILGITLALGASFAVEDLVAVVPALGPGSNASEVAKLDVATTLVPFVTEKFGEFGEDVGLELVAKVQGVHLPVAPEGGQFHHKIQNALQAGGNAGLSVWRLAPFTPSDLGGELEMTTDEIIGAIHDPAHGAAVLFANVFASMVNFQTKKDMYDSGGEAWEQLGGLVGGEAPTTKAGRQTGKKLTKGERALRLALGFAKTKGVAIASSALAPLMTTALTGVLVVIGGSAGAAVASVAAAPVAIILSAVAAYTALTALADTITTWQTERIDNKAVDDYLKHLQLTPGTPMYAIEMEKMSLQNDVEKIKTHLRFWYRLELELSEEIYKHMGPTIYSIGLDEGIEKMWIEQKEAEARQTNAWHRICELKIKINRLSNQAQLVDSHMRKFGRDVGNLALDRFVFDQIEEDKDVEKVMAEWEKLLQRKEKEA